MTETAFGCFETYDSISTGILACEKGFAPFADLLKDYEHQHFLLASGGYALQTNVCKTTIYFLKYGFTPNNTKQTVKGFTVYPREFFSPKDPATKKLEITDNTYTIHHFSFSWLSWRDKLRMRFERIRNKIKLRKK